MYASPGITHFQYNIDILQLLSQLPLCLGNMPRVPVDHTMLQTTMSCLQRATTNKMLRAHSVAPSNARECVHALLGTYMKGSLLFYKAIPGLGSSLNCVLDSRTWGCFALPHFW